MLQVSVLKLDNYIGHDWKTDSNYNRIINTVASRKFQPRVKIEFNPDSGDELQKLCCSRVDWCKNKLLLKRFYEHKSYKYDSMNEMERFGVGRYARPNIVIISFEDCLDFIYSCIFKTKLGGLKEFCKNVGINYKAYSRQHLAGGNCGDLYITDLYGFSPSFDVVITTMNSDDSIDRRLYFNKLFRFCEDFRNALLVHLDDMFTSDSDVILASVGITSAVFYSNREINGSIEINYKMYSTKLNFLSVKIGDYINHLDFDLCS